jgi:hypothetical protein
LLAGSRDGCTEAIMLAHNFKVEFLVDLINARLATAQTERMLAGGRWVECRIVKSSRRWQGSHNVAAQATKATSSEATKDTGAAPSRICGDTRGCHGGVRGNERRIR